MWISSVYKKDIHYEVAKKILQWIDGQSGCIIVSTKLLLAEISNFLQRKAAPEVGRNFVDTIIHGENIELYYDGEQYLDETIAIYNRIEQLGYVDSNNVVFYKLLKCTLLISFDSNYDGIKGLTRSESIPIEI